MGNSDLKITGAVLVYRLYDVAWDIDLLKVEERAREHKRHSIDRKRFSKAFEFANPPLALRLKSSEKTFGRTPYTVNTYAKVYDYGVLSVIFEILFSDITFEDLSTFAKDIDAPLRDSFRGELDRLIADLGDALHKVELKKIEEDYTVYYLKQLEPWISAKDFLEKHDVRGLLLYEEGESPPGISARNELLPYSFSYSDRDLVILGWDRAFMLEPSGSMDIPDLLEFANSQLLELRVYDDLLDLEIDRIYERIIMEASPSVWKIKRYETLASRAMRTVMDLTAITERIDNSVKVTEDVYYARIYTSALSLFKVRQWETSIERKLSIITRVYDMLYREISNKRIELLELIIIILIAIEIVLFFFDF